MNNSMLFYDKTTVLENTDLLQLISEYTVTKRQGARHSACCPIHGEKTPSFVINNNQTFKCFGCGAYGDAVNFIKAMHNVEFSEALEILAQRLNISPQNQHNAMNGNLYQHLNKVAKIAPIEEINYLPYNLLKEVKQRGYESNFYKYLAERVAPGVLSHYARIFFLSSYDKAIKSREGKYYSATLFNLLDIDFKYCNAKAMIYDIDTLKRFKVKKHPTLFHEKALDTVYIAKNYLRTEKGVNEPNTKTCFFGLHLLRFIDDLESTVIGLVESEKTAFIMNMVTANSKELTNFFFIATGGSSSFSVQKCDWISNLKIKSVCIFPDLDKENLHRNTWIKRCEDLNKIHPNTSFQVCNWLDMIKIPTEQHEEFKANGYDIADIVLDKRCLKHAAINPGINMDKFYKVFYNKQPNE